MDRVETHDGYSDGRPGGVGVYTHRFFDTVERIVCEGAEALGIVGGNIAIEFYDGTGVIVVTSGPALGVHYRPVVAPVHFRLRCEEWFLDNVLNPALGDDYDFWEAAIGAGLQFSGDIEVYRRFCRFARRGNGLDVRLGRLGV